jgi:glycosyltransferase involved in cell wall biosynthesis
MEQYCISVARCPYNGARFLAEQLESLSAQTRLPSELVVCDDGSKDGSLEILRAFASRAPFPVRTHVNEKNLGSTRNFEQAVRLCQGDVIALADQDDVWKPNKLEVLSKAFADHPSRGYVFSDAELIDESGSVLRKGLWESGPFRLQSPTEFTHEKQVSLLLQRSRVTGATMAFRSALRNLVLPFSACFIQDYWISLVLSCFEWYGLPICERLIQYRQHGSQQIGARRKTILEKIEFARGAGAREYSRRVIGLREVRRLLEINAAAGQKYPGSHLVLVEEALVHSCRREDAHAARVTARIGMVFREVLTGRYGRFSASWQSIIQDLCF